VGAALLSAAAVWIQVRVALRVWAQAKHLGGTPGSGSRRQINLPSAISLSAISRATKIYRAWPTALHFEQIDACARLTSAHDNAQVGG
jgi:hypothetical protein